MTGNTEGSSGRYFQPVSKFICNRDPFFLPPKIPRKKNVDGEKKDSTDEQAAGRSDKKLSHPRVTALVLFLSFAEPWCEHGIGGSLDAHDRQRTAETPRWSQSLSRPAEPDVVCGPRPG